MIKLIVATDKNGVIGSSSTNDLPWKCKEDMQFFKTMTVGHGVVMGRKTWESIPSGKKGKLPNRAKLVICHTPDIYRDHFSDDTMFASLDEGISNIHRITNSDVFIIGGASIYKEFAPMCHIHYVNKLDIEADVENPVYFDHDGDYVLVSSSKKIVDCDGNPTEMDQQVWLNEGLGAYS